MWAVFFIKPIKTKSYEQDISKSLKCSKLLDFVCNKSIAESILIARNPFVYVTKVKVTSALYFHTRGFVLPETTQNQSAHDQPDTSDSEVQEVRPSSALAASPQRRSSWDVDGVGRHNDTDLRSVRQQQPCCDSKRSRDRKNLGTEWLRWVNSSTRDQSGLLVGCLAESCRGEEELVPAIRATDMSLI